MAASKIGHAAAKVLGIKLDYRNELGSEKEKISRGESVFSVSSADSYVEEEPTATEWIQAHTPSVRDLGHYFQSLFPWTTWLHRYNMQWLLGDLVAGEPMESKSEESVCVTDRSV